MSADENTSLINADQPLAGQWRFAAYNHDFSSADGQAPLITQGMLVGEGYTGDFDINRIVNTARGDDLSADADDVGIIFTSTLNVAAGGIYRLTTSSDDGSRIIIRDGEGNGLFFDNEQGGRLDYLNNDFHQGLTTRYGDVELQPGVYTIEILYWENAGANLLFGTISGPDTGGDVEDLTRSSMIGLPPTPLVQETKSIMCFVRGTLIETADGVRPVEDLRQGDLIVTCDNGLQPLRWIGSRTLASADLDAAPWLRPIRITEGALAPNVPSLDLLVSPQHRVLIRSRIAHVMFGAAEVLVAAKQICNINGIRIAQDIEEVEYFHMLFDRHEIVLSNGAETESLYTGPEALKSVGATALEEIIAIFPELRNCSGRPVPARTLVPGRRARTLAERHKRNNKPMLNLHPQ